MSPLWAAALWCSAARVCSRRFLLRRDEAWLYGGLAFFGEAIAGAMGLGLCGLLRPWPLRALCAAFLLAHWRLAAASPPPRPRRAAPRQPWLLLPLGALAVVAGFRLLLALLAPPDSWDGLTYHLPIALRFVQQGNLDLSGWLGAERYYAWNGELLTAWMAVLDGGRFSFAKISQAFSPMLIAAAAASLGRRLAGGRWAGACAIGVAAAPMALVQAGVPYVDFLYSAFYLAAAAAGTACLRTGRREHLLACAAAVGLAFGAKSTIYFSALLLAAPALAFRLKPARRPEFLRLLPACAALFLVLGLAPYLRNWVQTRNPIYPFALKIAGMTVFPGPLSPKDLLVSMEKVFVSAPSQWLWYPLHERVSGVAEYSYENGFGPLFAAGWLLWPFALWRAARRRDWAAACFLGTIPATLLLFMVVQPVRTPRYIMYLVGFAIIAAACALRRARKTELAAARALWTAGIAWGLLGVAAHLGQSNGARESWKALLAGRPLPAADYYRWVFPGLGDAWSALNERLKPGDVVAVNYAELILPWSGFPPRARTVVVHDGASVYPQSYYALSGGDWVGQLDRLGVRYAVVWSPRWYPHQGDVEKSWIAERSERFKLFGHWESQPLGRADVYELIR